MSIRRNEGGFTIVELMSVMAVSALMVGLILYFGMSYWKYTIMLEADLDTMVSRLNAQDYIRDYVGTASGLIVQNSIPDDHAGAPDPVAGAQYWTQIHAVPGAINTGLPGTQTPVMYFRRASITTANVPAMNGTQPYEDEYVLYLDGTTKELRARTLANPFVADNKAVTTCPPEAASASCPADKVLVDGLTSITMTYYSRSGNTIDWTSIYDSDIGSYAGPDLPVVEAVQFALHVAKKPIFQQSNSTINDTVIRIAIRNT